MRRLLMCLCVLSSLVAPARAEEDCRLKRIVSLDMLPGYDPLVVVENAIGDAPLHMMVDTGGYVTSLTEDSAAKLDLRPVVYPESALIMYGGISLRRFVTVSDYRIGRLKAGSLSYPLLPSGSLPPTVDGILAPDFLARFDLDFDFAAGKFNMFSRDHCEGRVGYWTNQTLEPIPIIRSDDGVHIYTYVELDGKRVKALIDTGASKTVMSMESARYIYGISSDDPQLKPVDGPNGIAKAARYPFKKMKFGTVEVNNPNITLVSDRDSYIGGMEKTVILGMSVLRHLHIYIAYGEKNMYVTTASEHR